jgi:GNAT superfamily N-acetyltransferase
VEAMSLYSDYSEERFGFKTIEVEGGFITYAINPPEASIEEFYVKPSLRGTPLAKRLADQVFDIAKKMNIDRMWAKVTPGVRGAEHALVTNIHYGFKMVCVRGNDIILMKEVK